MLIKLYEEIPKGYGYAFDVLEKESQAMFLFPFNHIIGLCYMLWHKIKHAVYVRNYLMKRKISRGNSKTKIFEDIEIDGKRYLVVYGPDLCEAVKRMSRAV